MSRKLLFFFFIFLLAIGSNSTTNASVRYHCGKDSLLVMQLIESARKGDNIGSRVVAAAKALEGTPSAPAADNDSLGFMMVRLDSLNQREFIYAVIAAAKTAELTAPNLRDFEKNLENISRKKGVDEGFVSQFLYGSDWIVDNIYRGNLKEMTDYLDGGNYRTKTLDYVSRHPENFPAMANPAVADKIKVMEFGFRSHRIPHLKKQVVANKNFKELLENGDIIIMNPPDTDFDIYDIGVLSMENGEPTLIHISKESGEVVMDPYPLSRLFKIENQYFYGFRWLRPIE